MPQVPTNPTTQQLKGDIDAGRTGDKVPEGFDLGLATLGTDDEAAGTPATPREVALAVSQETHPAPRAAREQWVTVLRRATPAVWVMVAAFVAVLAVLALTAWHGRG
jgi:hypothetical protein